MKSARLTSFSAICVAVLMTCMGFAPPSGAQSSQAPTCTGWGNCSSGRRICTIEDAPVYVGPTNVSDFQDGVSSDGQGPYVAGTKGVVNSMVVLGQISLGRFGKEKDSRTLSVNLNHPVPGGGGVPLGIVTITGDNLLYAAWKRVGDTARSPANIPVGRIETAEQTNISFHLDGRFHVLQMGPRPLGQCHEGADRNRVHGTGTTSATIYRASPSRWVVDLPAGSIGRLFDISQTKERAIDKGLYYVHLHFELVDAVPAAAGVLRAVALAQGGEAVVARYRALKRDSATAYFFNENSLDAAGYSLLDNKRPADAAIVFRLKVEEYPAAWSGYDGLGESYLAAGDTAKAIASYRRVLELDPANKNAVAVLAGLGVRP